MWCFDTLGFGIHYFYSVTYLPMFDLQAHTTSTLSSWGEPSQEFKPSLQVKWKCRKKKLRPPLLSLIASDHAVISFRIDVMTRTLAIFNWDCLWSWGCLSIWNCAMYSKCDGANGRIPWRGLNTAPMKFGMICSWAKDFLKVVFGDDKWSRTFELKKFTFVAKMNDIRDTEALKMSHNMSCQTEVHSHILVWRGTSSLLSYIYSFSSKYL